MSNSQQSALCTVALEFRDCDISPMPNHGPSTRRRVSTFLTIAIAFVLPLALSACGGGSAPPPTYTVGGTVINLAGNGGGLVLRDNLNDVLPVTANGAFTFSANVLAGGTYLVTISQQPSNPRKFAASPADREPPRPT